jgi:uncharacterized membrane protein YgcG
VLPFSIPSAIVVKPVATNNGKDNWMKVLYIVLIVALIGLGFYLVHLVFKCLPVNTTNSRLAMLQDQLNRGNVRLADEGSDTSSMGSLGSSSSGSEASSGSTVSGH